MANTRVADVQVLGTHQLMIVGHQPGFSSLVVWDSQGNYVERQIWTEIAGHQQVMLNAIVAEVDLNRLEQMGANVSVALTQLGLTFVSLPGLVWHPVHRGQHQYRTDQHGSRRKRACRCCFPRT